MIFFSICFLLHVLDFLESFSPVSYTKVFRSIGYSFNHEKEQKLPDCPKGSCDPLAPLIDGLLSV